jgi:hypothetical protein
MGQTQLALIEINAFDLFALQKLQKVSSESSDKLVDNGGSGSLDFKGFIDGTGKLFVADSQFDFGLFLHGEFFAEEVDENLWCFSGIGAVDDVKSDS